VSVRSKGCCGSGGKRGDAEWHGFVSKSLSCIRKGRKEGTTTLWEKNEGKSPYRNQEALKLGHRGEGDESKKKDKIRFIRYRLSLDLTKFDSNSFGGFLLEESEGTGNKGGTSHESVGGSADSATVSGGRSGRVAASGGRGCVGGSSPSCAGRSGSAAGAGDASELLLNGRVEGTGHSAQGELG
jgi:hypothetical protein